MKHEIAFTSNNFFSFILKYIRQCDKRLSVRLVHLNSIVTAPVYNTYRRICAMHAGRRPQLHIEMGLFERVKRSHLSNLVTDFGQVPVETFVEQLDKAQVLMTNAAQFTGNIRKLATAANRVRIACQFDKKFLPATVEDAAYNKLNRQASSGFPRFTRKSSILEELIQQANLVITGKFQQCWDYPTTRGFKLFLRETNNQVNLKIRVMYPYPGVITLLETMFAMPFITHFIKTNTFYVTGRSGQQISELIKTKLSKANGRITSLDVSSFDQNMVNTVIQFAFGILRFNLQLSPVMAQIFDKICDYYCCSILVSKTKGTPVQSFIKLHGIPSGSGFTNLVGTLCHAIILEYLSPGILENSLVCGDDNIFPSTNIDLDVLFKGYKDIFNLSISLEKTENFTSWKSVNFLGFKWINAIRMISPKLAINQVLWHQNYRTDLDRYEREVARAASVLLNGQNGKLFFARLFPEIIDQINSGINVRFTYLYGYTPPVWSSLYSSKSPDLESVPGTNKSLKLHLEHGWAIR